MKKLLMILTALLMFSSISEAQLKAPIDLRMDYHFNFYIGSEDLLPGAAGLFGNSVGVAINNIGIYLTNIAGSNSSNDYPTIRSNDPLIPTDYVLHKETLLGSPVWNLWAVGGSYDILHRSTLYAGYVYGNRKQDVSLSYESTDPFSESNDVFKVRRTRFENHKGFEFGFIQRISFPEESFGEWLGWMKFYEISFTAGYNTATKRVIVGFGFNLNILERS